MSRGSRDQGAEPIASRRDANRELGRAKKGIEAARSFYIANAVIAGILLAFSLLLGGGALAAGVFGGLLLLAIVGATQIRKQPFGWSLVLAMGWTLLVAVRVVTTGLSISVPFGLMCLWTLGCWFSVRATSRAAHLMKENPDLRITRRIKGER